MAYNVLFVCTGNVCRSPAAERLLRRDLASLSAADAERVTTFSAGTGALQGEPMSAPMAALVAADGGTADDFVARQLSAAMVRNADLILTMTAQHRTETVALAPAAVHRTFVLGELAHMLEDVTGAQIREEITGSDAPADRLRAVVTVAKRNRSPGVDPNEDVVDPFGRSQSVYRESFRQIQRALEPLVRLVTGST